MKTEIAKIELQMQLGAFEFCRLPETIDTEIGSKFCWYISIYAVNLAIIELSTMQGMLEVLLKIFKLIGADF